MRDGVNMVEVSASWPAGCRLQRDLLFFQKTSEFYALRQAAPSAEFRASAAPGLR
jgi:hypothetical protein